MRRIIYGDVVGDECPECKESLDIVGDFYEGDELECEWCGSTVVIDEIAATYTLSLSAYKREED